MTNEELVSRIKAGIETAENMQDLYFQNWGMLYKIANKYAGMAEREDLMQECYIGLCRAVDGYEPENRASFSTYAWKVIQNHLFRHIRGKKNLPEYIQDLMGQYKKLSHAFMVHYGRKPTRREYSYYLDVTIDQLRKIEKCLRMELTASLDSPIGEEDMVLSDILTSEEDTEGTVLEKVQGEQLKVVLWKAVDNLPGELPEVVKKRYQDNMTLQGTGDSLGITPGRVKADEAKALRILRENQVLRSFTDDNIHSAGMKFTGVEAFNSSWVSATERVALKMVERY